VIALDTNVVVRLLTRDDPEQARRAVRALRGRRLWLPKTVLLETEWVLRFSYELAPEPIHRAFTRLLGLRRLQVEDRESVLRALSAYAGGLDFADALHLASSHSAESFLTFDRNLGKAAQRLDTVPPVRLL
jgi:predicted nucleic-acid-binding protein